MTRFIFVYSHPSQMESAHLLMESLNKSILNVDDVATIYLGFPKYADTALSVKESFTVNIIRIFILPNIPDPLFNLYIRNSFSPFVISKRTFSQDKIRLFLYKNRISMSNKNNQFKQFVLSL